MCDCKWVPIRKIPKNYRHITGIVASGEGSGYAFEGPLEIDFYTLMNHQRSIENIEGQPVTIEHRNSNGRWTRYTPDALIHFTPEVAVRPILAEVKPRDTLRKEWIELSRKIQAGIELAADRGWTFKVFTEQEIRTPYFENIKVLRLHRGHQFEKEELDQVAAWVEREPGIQFRDVLKRVHQATKADQAGCLSRVYHLLVKGRISADLFEPFSYQTPLLESGKWGERPWDKRWLRASRKPVAPHRKGW